MNATTAINAYTNIGLETSVTTADPHKLILLLYQGALLAISSAKNQMLRKDIAAKGKYISQAIMIIEEGLKASLDKNAGGELAQNLSDLYEYMSQRLLIGNLKNDVSALDEVSRLLSDLKGAWEEIRPVVMSSAQQDARSTPPAAPAKAEALTYGRI
ncbi:Flagellar secretion chaperone FliS [Gallionellaceae bacterium]|nr:Flagellar secretion chaperone FliS [Gallionellaceae bacterium]